MPYPSTISTISSPSPTDRLNSPSHSGVENAQSSAIGEIENFIGLAGNSSTVGTLLYDIRSSDSNGGGHVQTAVKGGTGQTTYTKGDILVAQSPSVLTKVAIGNDGDILKVNSSTASGVNWIQDSTPKVITSVLTTLVPPGTETSIVSVTVNGSTLGSTNAFFSRINLTLDKAAGANHSVIGRIYYGGDRVGSVLFSSKAAIEASSVFSVIEHTMVEDGPTNRQQNATTLFIPVPSVKSELTLAPYNTMTSSIESSANQTFGITLQSSGSGGTPGRVTVNTLVVEKIS